LLIFSPFSFYTPKTSDTPKMTFFACCRALFWANFAGTGRRDPISRGGAWMHSRTAQLCFRIEIGATLGNLIFFKFWVGTAGFWQGTAATQRAEARCCRRTSPTRGGTGRLCTMTRKHALYGPRNAADGELNPDSATWGSNFSGAVRWVKPQKKHMSGG